MGKYSSKTGKDTFQQKKIPLNKKANQGRRTVSKIKKATLRKDIKKKWKKLNNNGKNEPDIDKARAIIEDFKENGPSELHHIFFITEAIGKNIEIRLAKGDFELAIGRNESENPPVYLIYHKSGHWTRKLNEVHDCCSPNNCLFKAVSTQINRTPEEVETSTLKEMMEHEAHIAKKIADIEFLELINPLDLESGEIRYEGTCAKDAKKVLDDSQNGYCYPQKIHGHPRGHASHPTAVGPTESVENYSKCDRKTGFHSRSEQDMVTHLVLDSDDAQKMIDSLNDGSLGECLSISSTSLREDLPLASDYRYGKRIGSPQKIKNIKAVFKTYSKANKNRYGQVFILTIFPLIK